MYASTPVAAAVAMGEASATTPSAPTTSSGMVPGMEARAAAMRNGPPCGGGSDAAPTPAGVVVLPSSVWGRRRLDPSATPAATVPPGVTGGELGSTAPGSSRGGEAAGGEASGEGEPGVPCPTTTIGVVGAMAMGSIPPPTTTTASRVVCSPASVMAVPAVGTPPSPPPPPPPPALNPTGSGSCA